MNEFFTIGFEKVAKAKWQKMWKGLSPKSKGRITRYGKSGVKDLPKLREGMMAPTHSKKVLKRRNLMDKKIYENFRRKDPRVLKRRSDSMPYAYAESSRKGGIALPKNPAKGKQTRAKDRPDLRGAKGTHNRAMLEHEKSEYKMEMLKRKRTKGGAWARKQKAIYEDKDTLHSSAYPLVAEANIAGRSKKSLEDMKKAWGETKAQGKMYKKLKEHGWTPGSGLPVYGKASRKFQRVAEKEYGSVLKKKLKKKETGLARKYKGKALSKRKRNLKSEFREFAK